MKRLLGIALLSTLVACGGGNKAKPDAGGGSDGQNLTCPGVVGELTPGATTVMSTVVGGGADLDVDQGVCTTESGGAYYEPKGEDVVVHVSGLTAGTTYVVTLDTTEDLSFYVTTTCPPASGKVTNCVLFTDETVENELGAFAATGPEAWIIVDNAADPSPPTTGQFVLGIDVAECQMDMDCATNHPATPVCDVNTFTCVQCTDSAQCTDAATPICSLDEACVAGPAACVNDDAGDNGGGDDTAGTARSIDGAVGATQTMNARICSQGDDNADEFDFYSFDVTDGQGEVLTLSWTDNTADLDLVVIGPDGINYGISYYQPTEKVTLTYLPAGHYVAQVSKFDTTASTTTVAYTLTAKKTAKQSCSTSADCASEFATQFYRGTCDSTTKACAYITDTDLAASAPCDDNSECTSGFCSYNAFESDAQLSVCTDMCATDTDCTTFGSSFHCTAGLTDAGGQDFCTSACTVDLQCGADPAAQDPTALSPAASWNYASCAPGTGVCTFGAN